MYEYFHETIIMITFTKLKLTILAIQPTASEKNDTHCLTTRLLANDGL